MHMKTLARFSFVAAFMAAIVFSAHLETAGSLLFAAAFFTLLASDYGQARGSLAGPVLARRRAESLRLAA